MSFTARKLLLGSVALLALGFGGARAEDSVVVPALTEAEMGVALDAKAPEQTAPSQSAGATEIKAPVDAAPAGTLTEATPVSLSADSKAAEPVAATINAKPAEPALVPAEAKAPEAAPVAHVEAKTPEAAPAAPVEAKAPETAPVAPVEAKTPEAAPVAPVEAKAPEAAPAVPVEAKASDVNAGDAQKAMEATTADTAYDQTVSAAIGDRLAAMDSRDADAVRDHGALSAFYATRGNAPAWSSGGKLSPVGKATIERLALADTDGLDATAFAVSGLDRLTGHDSDAAVVADSDLAISMAVLKFARQAAGGRIDPARISRNIAVKPHEPEPAMALVAVASAADPASALESFNPVHPQFAALKAKLAEIRAAHKTTAAEAQPAPIVVPGGPLLKQGMTDPRVALLRERLGITTISDAEIYDEAVVDAVRSFQRDRKLKVTGIVGPQTLTALNGKAAEPDAAPLEAEIIANMERWRWMPRDLGTFNILVNVPEFHLVVSKNGAMVHESRVIVGKPETPTPIFSESMQFVVLNPYWHVPQSIIRKEFLPRLQADPTYLSRRGFELVSAGGKRISPSAIDWSAGVPRIGIRQPPGDSNALGHIKFMFPNDFSVYLHDTSSRGLFASERRAFSHGCVRVDLPFRLAEIVLGAENGWTEDRVRKSIGGGERRVDLKDQIAVHIAYFTAKVDENGELKTFEDIYGIDRRVLDLLGS